MTSPAAAAAIAAVTGERASGRQAWSLLWSASRRLSILVIAWALASALTPPLVVAALGEIVGRVPGAIRDGISSDVTRFAPQQW